MKIRSLFYAGLIAATGTGATAAGAPQDQLLALVENELPRYVRGVDARDLSRSQLATIYMLMHSSRSTGAKQALIRSTIGGPYSLRGLLKK